MKEIFIELTDKCNLSCSYCNKHYWDKFISIWLFEKIIEQVFCKYINKIDFICLWWWEPLLHPKIDKILNVLYNYISKINIEHSIDIVINTNWTLLLNKLDTLNKFINNIKNIPNIRFRLYVSLDEIWASSTRKISYTMFENILQWIFCFKKLIKGINNVEIKISSVVSNKPNIFKQIFILVKFFKRFNININFCFEESLWNYIIWRIYYNELIKVYYFLKKENISIVIESKKDLNNVIRIDVLWNIYNFIDRWFCNYKNFILSYNWDLSFLKNEDWILNLSNNEIWNYIYKNKNYIYLIKKIYYLNV